MKVLIAEDDQYKLRKLSDFLRSRFGTHQITEKKSYQSALKELLSARFDIVLLDMSMPTFDRGPGEKGGRTRVYAGRDILIQLKERDISTPVVVVTQYDVFGEKGEQVELSELVKSLAVEFSANFRGAVFYEAASQKWQTVLGQLIEGIFKERDNASRPDSG